MISYYDSIEKLGLDVQVFNAIKKYFAKDVVTIKDICSLTSKDILLMRNIGKKGFQDTLIKLHTQGFFLADEVKKEDLVSSEQRQDDLLTELVSKKDLICKRIEYVKDELSKLETLNKEIDFAIAETKGEKSKSL